ncbi:GtrA family protein [Gammaproteobacteria bacterium]|nr:GtrA family protein [Gammaproteobacteria bacterium]
MENIFSNFIKFFAVGCIAFATDISLYFFFLSLGFVSLVSKAVSFICGLVVGYFLNSFFTFNRAKITKNKFSKYILVYFVSLVANMSVNESIVIYLQDTVWQEVAILGAVICATIVSLLMNFFGLRYYVFKS